MKIGKIILGALAGATLIYAVKKRAVKKEDRKSKWNELRGVQTCAK